MAYYSIGGVRQAFFAKFQKKLHFFSREFFAKKIRENLDFRATFTSRQILKNIAQIQKATSRAWKKG